MPRKTKDEPRPEITRHDPPPYVTLSHKGHGTVKVKPADGHVDVVLAVGSRYDSRLMMFVADDGVICISAEEWRQFTAHVERILGA